MTTIRGIITGIRTKDDETGNVFATVRYEDESSSLLTPTNSFFSGYYKGLAVNDFVELVGGWRKSTGSSGGETFKASSIRPDLPRIADSSRAWLIEVFKGDRFGVTPESVDRFLAAMGPGALVACERDPEQILQVSAAPHRFRSAILQEWGRRISGRRAIALMERVGVDRKKIELALDAYRDGVWEVVSSDPYRLARIPRFEFSTADVLGRATGIGSLDDRRVAAAFLDCVTKARSQGDTYVCVDEVGDRLARDFDIPAKNALAYATSNISNPLVPFSFGLVGDMVAVADRDILAAEMRVADGVVSILRRGASDRDGREFAQKALASDKKFAVFDDIQRSGVVLASTERFAILTGGPGTGKSTVMEAIVLASEAKGRRVVLAAPTGKAAKRLAETTKRETETVHLLLEARPSPEGGMIFGRNKSNPLPRGSFVFVDEASMLDAITAAALVDAIPTDGGLVLVGDRNQLPSVDAGAVLRDLLAARDPSGRGIVPVVELINVYRQDKRSMIAVGAAMVREGKTPAMTNVETPGGLVFEDLPSSAVTDRIVSMVRGSLIPQGYRAEHVAILSPQAPGTAGTIDLNARLAKVWNPRGEAIPGVARLPGTDEEKVALPRIGDRVMAVENDYDTGVANGDTGEIVAACSIKAGRGSRPGMRIRFDDGREIEFPAASWRRFPLAYAITVHKSQGSQYPVVIMPVVGEHRGLDRSIVYTGWTRAKNKLFLIGQREAFDASLSRLTTRSTRVSEFIREQAVRHGLSAKGPVSVPPLRSNEDSPVRRPDPDVVILEDDDDLLAPPPAALFVPGRRTPPPQHQSLDVVAPPPSIPGARRPRYRPMVEEIDDDLAPAAPIPVAAVPGRRPRAAAVPSTVPRPPIIPGPRRRPARIVAEEEDSVEPMVSNPSYYGP